MTRIKKLNRRIKAKRAELEDDRADRRRARRVLENAKATIPEVREELGRARRRVRRRRAAIEELRADLEELEQETPCEDTSEEAELEAQLEQLADELDEAIADRDRLLDRLDRWREKRADAREALEQAIAESREDREALQRLRRRRKRAREARDRNDQPSPNFDWAEFDCNDGTELPEESKPAVRDWCQRIGEPVRARFGAVRINSAYRHSAYNARIGGASASVHIYDHPGRNHKAVAVDFRCAQGTPSDWHSFTAGKADGRGLYPTFHHADTRNRIGWPDASWSG